MELGPIIYRAPTDGDGTREDVERSFNAIFSTHKGTVPLKRGYGIDPSVLDYPLPVAKTLLAEAIYNAADEYEERAEIVDVQFTYDAENDRLSPVISYEIVSESDTMDVEDEYEVEDDEYE
ncbi:MAG: GPW/gp25 family protein [Clostridium sp.]|nr:GPW/gp25 family protein [Clostridium sp.]